MFSGNGRSIADRRTSPMTSGGIWDYDTMVTSEWGTPNMMEHGVNPDILFKGGYGHALHLWDLRKSAVICRRWISVPSSKWCWSCVPLTIRVERTDLLGVVVSLKDLSASVWLWHHENGKWSVKKMIEIPAEPAEPDKLPPLLQGFKAVPPLITDINLSLDDRFFYVSCWGTGEFRQYDVSDPFNPKLTASVHLGGIVRRATHPKKPKAPLNGGPQMVEVSRDGQRVYFTNSLYSPGTRNSIRTEFAAGW